MNQIEQECLTPDLDPEKFRLAADKASDQVVIADPAGAILYANEVALRLCNRSREETVGRNVKELGLWGGLMSDRFQQEMWDTVIKKKRPFFGEVTNRRKAGGRYVCELRLYPAAAPGAGVDSILGLGRDLSRERELDRSRTNFISIASHQLRTPLTAISLSIDIMLRDPKNGLTEAQKKPLQEILKNIHEMAKLIETLLDVSKVQLGNFLVEPKSVDIVEIAELVLDELMPIVAGKRLALTKTYDHSLPTVTADRNIAKIALQNLLANAVKYTPAGGRVALAVRREGKSVLAEVKDSGYGIPVQEQHKVFTQFFRAANVMQKETRGTGLGLYLTKLLLETIGANISFTSAEGEGSSFRVRFPAAAL